MKKILFLFIIGIFLLFLDNSNAAVCCDTGCYTFANVCCGASGQTVGVEGCFNPGTNQYLCPDESRLGECLSCENNKWKEDIEGIDNCNVCLKEYDSSNNPIGSTCDPRCPEGKVMKDNECFELNELTEDVVCLDDNCAEGLVCTEEVNGVCSGDYDADGILNFNDNCVEIANPEQEDEDKDCILKGGKSSLFGYCVDACEGQGLGDDPYGGRQCCDNLAGTQGDGQFFGFTQDCPLVQNGIGCWSSCFRFDGNDKITYKSGACVNGRKTITEPRNNVETGVRFEESCVGLPLVPFFTWVNILITVSILSLYYVFRRN